MPFKPRIYTRYVNDLFLLFSDVEHLELFQQFMNNRDSKFITRHSKSFLTGTYGKPTFSDIYTNYDGLIPSGYKASLVTALLERCFQIASSYEIVHKEIEKLKTTMIKNVYPRPFLDKVITYFLDKKFNC